MKPIDLTLAISPKLPTFPGSPSPQFIRWSTIKDDSYNLELLFFSSHSGTHIDAPYHFVNNGKKIHQIPISRLEGKASLIKVRKGPDSAITKQDIESFEKKNGTIPKNSSVIFFTGWQKNISRESYFTHNPGLSSSAARYLASKRLNLVGIDAPSIDLGRDANFAAHKIFARSDILIVENLANLEKIRDTSFHFVILPLKLYNATGSPVRAIAIQ